MMIKLPVVVVVASVVVVVGSVVVVAMETSKITYSSVQVF